jgi:hypothetical protein
MTTRTYILHGLKISTHCDYKPIPDRSMDWSAVEDSYEPGMPCGWGRTEALAVQDLLEQLEDREPEEQATWDGDRS